MCYDPAMKKVRIVSPSGNAADTKVFIGEKDVTKEMRLERVLIEGPHEENRVWLLVAGAELDIVGEVDDGQPPVDRLFSLERNIGVVAADIEARLTGIERQLDSIIRKGDLL